MHNFYISKICDKNNNIYLFSDNSKDVIIGNKKRQFALKSPELLYTNKDTKPIYNIDDFEKIQYNYDNKFYMIDQHDFSCGTHFIYIHPKINKEIEILEVCIYDNEISRSRANGYKFKSNGRAKLKLSYNRIKKLLKELYSWSDKYIDGIEIKIQTKELK